MVSDYPPQSAAAQPIDLRIIPATTTTYAPCLAVAETPTGPVYVDAKGRTL